MHNWLAIVVIDTWCMFVCWVHVYIKCVCQSDPEYMAPEMYQSRFAPYNIGVDVWAMGANTMRAMY